MQPPELVPICKNCHRAIWPHQYGGQIIWRHFVGPNGPGAYMLCMPDEDDPRFTGTEGAEPMTLEEYERLA